MNFTKQFKIARRALNGNKFRCCLKMLGIIIGVASVITMLAIGEGSKASIRDQISKIGSNMLTIRPGTDRGPGGARLNADEQQSIKLDDYQAIVDENTYLSHVSPGVQRNRQAS